MMRGSLRCGGVSTSFFGSQPTIARIRRWRIEDRGWKKRLAILHPPSSSFSLFMSVLLVLVMGGGELDLDAEAGLAAFDVDGFAAASYAGLGGDEAVSAGGDAAHDEVSGG